MESEVKSVKYDKLKVTLETSLGILGFKQRTLNIFTSLGLEKVRQLTEMTRNDLLKKNWIGKNTVAEIQAVLVDYGFSIKDGNGAHSHTEVDILVNRLISLSDEHLTEVFTRVATVRLDDEQLDDIVKQVRS